MRVLYFAWLRERLNRNSDEFAPPPEVISVGDLIGWIAANDEGAALAFADRKAIRAAIDEQLVEHDAPVAGARTVALFPPMTGG